MAYSWTTGLTVAEVGEQGLLARILPLLPSGHGVRVGPGDDSAVIDWAGTSLVTTTDLMVEGPDFRRDWSTGYDVGWKAMASNLSDIAAMGAVARGVSIGLAVPGDTAVSAVEDIARGVAGGLQAMAPECGVWGGDLSTAPQVMIAVTVMGDLEGRAPVTRSGARSGHVVAHAGELGQSSRGLHQLLATDAPVSGLEGLSPEVVAHLRPHPPIHLGVQAALAGASAMMDVSDGLLMDAGRLAAASGVSIDLDEAIVSDHHSLTGGEDHGLLACFPSDAHIPDGFVIIGRVGEANTDGPAVTVAGRDPGLGPGGWDPYRRFSSE